MVLKWPRMEHGRNTDQTVRGQFVSVLDLCSIRGLAATGWTGGRVRAAQANVKIACTLKIRVTWPIEMRRRLAMALKRAPGPSLVFGSRNVQSGGRRCRR